MLDRLRRGDICRATHAPRRCIFAGVGNQNAREAKLYRRRFITVSDECECALK